MKYPLLLAVACTAVTSQAAIWQLDFGPPGAQFGLNGPNERPLPPVPSSATGRELQDYASSRTMQYNTDTDQIELHFGWGNIDFVNGTDLQSQFRMMHIHGQTVVAESA